jgi:hypothetical protein
MSAGALIYCFDTEQVQYHACTNFAISLIKKNLNLPVTVVTNEQTKEHIRGQDQILLIEQKKGNRRFYNGNAVPWYNADRTEAYEHSPYDTTLLLDSDYFVYTNNLLQLLSSDEEFLLYQDAYDLTDRKSFDYQTMSVIPMVWATVIVFKKCEKSKQIFEMVKHIKSNYSYFCNLYRIQFSNYRNDYAFAMALNQLFPEEKRHLIPGSMSMLPADTEVTKIDEHGLTFKFDKYINFIEGHDVHVYNKEIKFNV